MSRDHEGGIVGTALPPNGASALAATAPPSGLYWGWVMVAALGVSACVSYGVLLYSVPLFLLPMETELGWSRSQLTGAVSAAWLVAGLAGIPLGRWVDRHGARAVMTGGSLLAAALLLAWSRVRGIEGFYVLWLGLGIACAALFYEPAFAVVAVWFDRHRGRALTLLTFLGGLASVLFVPLTSWLVAARGWREALVWLAVALLGITLPLHALLLRRRPQDHGLLPDGAPRTLAREPRDAQAREDDGPSPTRRPGAARLALRSAPFRRLAFAFGLATIASTAMTVHLVPLLLDRGQSTALAAGAMGMLGLMALPGRLVFTPLGDRWPRGVVTAAIFALQALAVVPLLISSHPGAVWAFVALFGAGFGAVTPARAALLAELYGAEAYATLGGVMALVLAGARALAPLGASLLERAAGGYGPVLAAVLALSVASGVLTLAAGARAEASAVPNPAIRPSAH
jgi:MFS family permease